VQIILSGICAVFFVWVAALNLWGAIQGYRGRWKGSLVPVIGGIAGAAAIIIYPDPDVHYLWFLPLLLDIGCVPILALTAIHKFKSRS
jgi:hypothetical protein